MRNELNVLGQHEQHDYDRTLPNDYRQEYRQISHHNHLDVQDGDDQDDRQHQDVDRGSQFLIEDQAEEPEIVSQEMNAAREA